MKNKTTRFLLVLVAILTVLPVARAQKKPNITFVQKTNVELKKGEKDYYEIDLKAEPFTLYFEGNELMVSAGLEEDLFQHTKPDTDINKDFNSNFYIFKYVAGSPDTDYLIIEEESANSLNKSHGAKPAGKKMSQFTVRSLLREGKTESIANFKQLFMALWLDRNKDQFIDKKEMMWVKVNLKE